MSLLSKASLVVTPNAYKSEKLYSVIPNTAVGDFTVSRASAATRINTTGNIETVGDHIPRLDYTLSTTNPYILLEPASTNLITNSNVVTNQTVVLTISTTYTFSFYGTGTVTFGNAYAGTLVGTGANVRVTRTFTSSTSLTSLIISVSGSCLNGQLEKLQFATSYIPTNVLTTRIKDNLYINGISSLIGQTEGVLYFNMAALFNDQTNKELSISDGTLNNYIRFTYKATAGSGSIGIAFAIGGAAEVIFVTAYPIDITTFTKFAIRYRADNISFWVNGTNSGSYNPTILPIGLNSVKFSSPVGGNIMYAKVKVLHLYKTYLTDLEMNSLTTL